MTWFEVLMGFREMSPSQVRENITVDGEIRGRTMIKIAWSMGHRA